MDQQSPEPRPENETAFQELKGFRVLQELGRSPKAITYRARRLVEQDIVAVKVFRPTLCEKKFVSELPKHAEETFLLDHPGLVKALGCINENGRILLIMDYAPGEALARALKRKVPFAVPRALRVVLHCANALRYAALHKRTHGRLHPADIILGEDDARILGVGLGERSEHAAWSVRDPYIFEPLIYTAPEAAPSRSYPDDLPFRCAIDVYSLGGILFHLLTGQPPFQGTDEDSLVVERKVLGKPVQWPAPANDPLQPKVLDFNSLPEIKALVEKMLSPDPAARPPYDELIGTLSKMLLSGEHLELRYGPMLIQPQAAALKAPSAARSAHPAAAATAHSPTSTGTQISPVQLVRQAEPQTPLNAFAERLYTTILVGMTAIVFIFAIVLSAKIFWYDRIASNGPMQNAQIHPAPPIRNGSPIAESHPGEAESKKPPVLLATPGPVVSTEQALAIHQVEKIQEMLKKGEMQHTAGLLRVVRGLAEKAGKDTPSGIQAVVLAAEIEESLLQKYNAASAPPAAQIPPPSPPATQNEKPLAKEVPEKPAAAKDNATPESVAQPKPPGETALNAKEAPSAIETALKAAMLKVRKFQYNAVREDIAKAAALAEGDDKKKAAACAEIVQLEQGIFERCRTRLLERIARHPQHNSPLQVFPRKNDPIGEDIVDFDESGLRIAAKKGPAVGVRTQSWENVPPLQALALMQLLVEDKSNMDDELGLAAYAFNHGLKRECQIALETVRGMPKGPEACGVIEDQFKLAGRIIDGAAGGDGPAPK